MADLKEFYNWLNKEGGTTKAFSAWTAQLNESPQKRREMYDYYSGEGLTAKTWDEFDQWATEEGKKLKGTTASTNKGEVAKAMEDKPAVIAKNDDGSVAYKGDKVPEDVGAEIAHDAISGATENGKQAEQQPRAKASAEQIAQMQSMMEYANGKHGVRVGQGFGQFSDFRSPRQKANTESMFGAKKDVSLSPDESGFSMYEDENGEMQVQYEGRKGDAYRVNKEQREYAESMQSLEDRFATTNTSIEKQIAEESQAMNDLRAGQTTYYNLGGNMIRRQSAMSPEFKDHERNYNMLTTAQRKMQETQRVLDAAQRYKDDPNAFTRFFKDYWTSALSTATDLSTWDFGMTDLNDAVNIRNLYDKADRGEKLTSAEQSLLDAVTLNSAMQLKYEDEQGVGNMVGQTVVEMVPFMVEMALNPASGFGSAAGKSMAQKMARYAAKRFMRGQITKQAGKWMVRGAKWGTRAMADIGAGAVMANTSGAMRTGADVLDRMNNNDDMSIGRAVFEGEANAIIQNQSEFVGEYFEPLMKVVGKGVVRGMERGAMRSGSARLQKMLSSSLDVMNRIGNTKAYKTMQEFNDKAHYNGPLGEYIEEFIGNVELATLGVDQEFSTGKNGVFNPEDNWATFLAVAVPGVTQSVVATTQHAATKGVLSKRLSDADKRGDEKFGYYWHHLRSGADKALAGCTDDFSAAGAELAKIEKYFNLKGDGLKAFRDYVKAKSMSLAYDIAATEKEEDDEDEFADAIEALKEKGHEIETHEEAHEAGAVLDAAEVSLNELDGNIKVQIDRMREDGVSDGEMLSFLNDLSEDERQAAEDYLHAQAVVDGIEEKVSDDVQKEVDNLKAEIEPYIDPESGNFITAMLDDEMVYVKGIVGDTVYYFDDEGNVKSTDISNVTNIEVNFAESYIENFGNTLYDKASADAETKINNHPNTNTILDTGDNSEFTLVDADNNVTKYKVLENNGESITYVELIYFDEVGGYVPKKDAMPFVSSIERVIEDQNLSWDAFDKRRDAESEVSTEETAEDDGETVEGEAVEETPAEEEAEAIVEDSESADAERPYPVDADGEFDYNNATEDEAQAYFDEVRSEDGDEVADTLLNNLINEIDKQIDKLAGKEPKLNGLKRNAWKAEHKKWEDDMNALNERAQRYKAVRDGRPEESPTEETADVATVETMDAPVIEESAEEATMGTPEPVAPVAPVAPTEAKKRVNPNSLDERIKKLGDPQSLWESIALNAFGYKYVWGNDKNGTRGLGSHLFGNPSEAERRRRLSILASRAKGGLYPEEVAERMMESLSMAWGENIDEKDVFDTILDVLSRYENRGQLVSAIEEMREKQAEDEANAQIDAMNREAQSLGFKDYDEMVAYEEVAMESIVPMSDEQYDEYINQIIEENDRRIENETPKDAGVSAGVEQGAESGSTEAGSQMGVGQQEDTNVGGAEVSAESGNAEAGSESGDAVVAEREGERIEGISREGIGNAVGGETDPEKARRALMRNFAIGYNKAGRILDAIGLNAKTEDKNETPAILSGEIFKNNMAGGDAVVRVLNYGNGQVLVEYTTELDLINEGQFLGDRVMSVSEFNELVKNGSFTPTGKMAELGGKVHDATVNTEQPTNTENTNAVEVVSQQSEAQAEENKAPKKTTKKPKKTESEHKIDDWGEKLLGARKDMLKELAKTLDNVTAMSLVQNPLSKVFKKPDFGKLVASGALREKDARVCEAIVNALIPMSKPKAGTREDRVYAYNHNGKSQVQAWAEEAAKGVETLNRYMKATEEERDAMLEELTAEEYPFKEEEEAEYKKREELNPGMYFARTYTPNPITFALNLLDDIGYKAGDKLSPLPRARKAKYSNGLEVVDEKGKRKYYGYEDDVRAFAALYVKATDCLDGLEIPERSIHVRAKKRKKSETPTGWSVMYFTSKGNIQEQTFRDEQEAKEYEEKIRNNGYMQVKNTPVYGYVGDAYSFVFTDPKTAELIELEEGKYSFASADEAREYLQEHYDEVNAALVEANSKAKNKEIKKREPLVVSMVHTKNRWGYSICYVDPIVKSMSKGLNDYVPIKDFETKKEAEEYLKEHKEELLAPFQKIKDEVRNFVYFTPENERKGEDYRNGRDVTEEEFGKEFGFRGVQFGNWANQQDRQEAINQAYDAFKDMARALGLSDKAMSLNGELGIAFGSRGKGSANAHYEPAEVVINLTKTRGAGSLAHEWLHALDNYFSRANGDTYGMVTAQSTTDGMRPELRRAFTELMNAVRKTDYHDRSVKRGTYWGSSWEVAARLFAEYIKDKLNAEGKHNSFLSRGIEEDRYEGYMHLTYMLYRHEAENPMSFEEWKKTPQALGDFPYPTKEETKALAPLIENVFSTIKEEVKSDGTVRLYQIGDNLEGLTEEQKETANTFMQMVKDAGVPVGMASQEELAQIGGELQASKKKENFKFGDKTETEWLSAIQAIAQADNANTDTSTSTESQTVSVTNLGRLKRIANELDNIIAEIQKKILTQEELRQKLVVALQATVGTDSRYNNDIVIGDGRDISIRIANHYARANNYLQHGHNKAGGNYGFVVHQSEGDKFRSEPNVDYAEFVYFGDKIEGEQERQIALIEGIKHLVETGSVAKMPKVDSLNVSGKYKAAMNPKVQRLTTPSGVIYGVAYNGVIYLNKDIIKADTPLHEYTHLWDNMLQTANPKMWEAGKELLKQTSVWQDVMNDPNYADIWDDENKVASEVHSRLTGEKGARMLEDEVKKGKDASFVEKVKQWIKDVFTWVRNTLSSNTEGLTLDEFLAMPIRDLAEGVDPTIIGQRDDVQMQVGSDSNYEAELANILSKAKRDSQGRLLAPNGKPTNLTDRQYAQVRTKAFKDWFGDWENDPKHASKIVDENGEPMVMIHGSQNQFTEFKKFSPFGSSGPGMYFGRAPKGTSEWSYGGDNGYKYLVFLNVRNLYDIGVGLVKTSKGKTVSPQLVKLIIGSDSYSQFVEYQNTLINASSNYKRLVEEAKTITPKDFKNIHDKYDGKGIFASDKNVIKHWFSKNETYLTLNHKHIGEIVVRDPNQIKSATDNVGTFDRRNDIRFRTDGVLDAVHDIYTNPIFVKARRAIMSAINEFANVKSKKSKFGGEPETEIVTWGYDAILESLGEGLGKVYSQEKAKALYDTLKDKLEDYIFVLDEKIRNKERWKQGKREIDVYRNERDQIQYALDYYRNAANGVNVIAEGWDTPKFRNGEEGVRSAGNKMQMSDAVADVARRLNSDAEVVSSDAEIDAIEGLTEAEKRDFKQRGKAVFVPMTGKIYVNINNNMDEADAVKSVIHEAVGHKGLRQMFGKMFTEKMREVYGLLPQEAKKEIAQSAIEDYGFDIVTATEEWLAREAESNEDPTLWNIVKSALRDMLRKLGFDIMLNRNDVRYLLWQSKNQLTGDPMMRAMSMMMRKKLGINEVGEGGFPPTPPSGSRISRRVKEWKKKYGGADVVLVADDVTKDELMNAGFTEEDAEKAIELNNQDSFAGAYFSNSEKILIFESADKYDDTEFDAIMFHENIHAALDNLRQWTKEGLFRDFLSVYNNKKLTNFVEKMYKDFQYMEEVFVYAMEDVIVNGKVDELVNMLLENDRDIINNILKDLNYGEEERVQRSRQAGKNGYVRIWESATAGERNEREERKRGERKGGEAEGVPEVIYFGRAVLGATDSGINIIAEDNGSARAMYERTLNQTAYHMQEIFQDSMLGLKTLMTTIMRSKGKRFEDVSDWENAYWAENRMSSTNEQEFIAYRKMYYAPLLKAVKGLMQLGNTYSDIVTYMMAKHGLERNEVMAMRDAQRVAKEEIDYENRKSQLEKDLADGTITPADYSVSISNLEAELATAVQPHYEDNRKRDYAGLTQLTGHEKDDEIAEIEADAQRFVDDFESASVDQMDAIDELWEKVNAATKAQLEKQYQSGMMNEVTYLATKDMYQYYIPLRGFEDVTSDEVYDYLQVSVSPMSEPLKKAEGRTSQADDPIATIGNMAESGIMVANRNLMKQKFLLFVENNPSDLCTINEYWAHENSDGSYTTILPDIPADATESEAEDIRKQFEEDMIRLSEDDDTYKKKRGIADIPYRTLKRFENEHQVVVKRGGKTYIISVNGNPRAAQAINGLTNPDADSEMMKWLGGLTNWMARCNTTWSVPFIFSNLCRDAFYANSMVLAKESWKYSKLFSKNWAKTLVKIVGLVHRYNNGTLDMSKEMDRYFSEFILAGGETGVTRLTNVEGYKDIIKDELKKMGRGKWHFKNLLDFLGNSIELLNRSAEDTSRFAAYMTSRQYGRSVSRSIWDAKEVSVNFNKKGAAGKTKGAWEEGNKLTYSLGMTAQFIRPMYMFFNAGVQGMFNIGRIAKNHRGKFASVAASYFFLGIIMPMINAILSQGGGDGDDNDNYWNLPEYIRRNNLCIYAGNGYITLPLPIELRAIYGLGDIFVSKAFGANRKSADELVLDIACQFSQIFPIDFLEGSDNAKTVGELFGSLVPSPAKPWYELVINRDYTGRPIYKEHNDNNIAEPEFQMVYSRTDKTLINASKALNDFLGGNDHRKAKVFDKDADVNPAKVQHIIQSYLGAMGKMVIFDMARTAETMFTDDFEWTRVPVVNRFFQRADDRTKGKALKNEFYKYNEKAKELESEFRGWERALQTAELKNDSIGKADALYHLQRMEANRDAEKFDRWNEMKREYNEMMYKSGEYEDKEESIEGIMNDMIDIFKDDKKE